jgi:hypothetical protein
VVKLVRVTLRTTIHQGDLSLYKGLSFSKSPYILYFIVSVKEVFIVSWDDILFELSVKEVLTAPGGDVLFGLATGS